MICNYCGFDNADGSLFCDGCSLPLSQVNQGSNQATPQNNPPGNPPNASCQTNPLPNINNNIPLKNPTIPNKPALCLVTGNPKSNNLPRLIIMENLVPTGEFIKLPRPPYNVELTLGRNDLKNGMVVDIDLTSAGGYEKKVSRKHVFLGHDGKSFTIKDAGSTHGTFINKKKIDSGKRYTLKPGDEIRLAELCFKIE